MILFHRQNKDFQLKSNFTCVIYENKNVIKGNFIEINFNVDSLNFVYSNCQNVDHY